MSDDEWVVFLKKQRRQYQALIAINLAFIIWAATSQSWLLFGLSLVAGLAGAYTLGEIEKDLNLWPLIYCQRNLIKKMLKMLAGP